ncbi:MAG: hypothetical protein WCI18_02865 [Pseudomonadota bacterium]
MKSRNVKSRVISGIVACSLMIAPKTSRADVFGGDVVVLTQILANAIQQLLQLRQLLSTGQDTLSLMQDVNRGLNDALGLVNSVGAALDPGLYRELLRAQDALRYVKNVYGNSVDSSELKVQQDADQTAAEAISLNNSIYGYAREIDQIGEKIKRNSNVASPKGAQKITAQSLGIMLHVMNQSLRAQATGLKLQAQSMAIQNRKDKVYSDQVRSTSDKLNAAMTSMRPEFKFPRL